MSLRGKIAALRQQSRIRLPPDHVREVVERWGIEDWFYEWAFLRRSERPYIVQPCLWLAAHLPGRARILETGCGNAMNLLWFGECGFRRLDGFDLNENAIAAAKEHFAMARLDAVLWVDDGVRAEPHSAEPYDAILAFNWLYLVKGFDLSEFLARYRAWLAPGGLLALDLMDTSYNTVPRNQYHTKDWDLPEAQRRPSEYCTRYSAEQLEAAAAKTGFHVRAKWPVPAAPPVYSVDWKRPYILEKPHDRL